MTFPGLKQASPLDHLLRSSDKTLVTSPVHALRATWQAAREALEVARSPVRAFAELSLGEIMIESGRMSTNTAGDQATSAFKIHNLMLSAAAYFRMALDEQESGIGFYRTKALRSIDQLLENTATPSNTYKYEANDFSTSCQTLGKAILESQIKILHLRERPWRERSSVDAQLQGYAARLDTTELLKGSLRGTTLLRSLLSPENGIERMYSDALARIIALPYKVLNVGPLLRDNFSTAKRQWQPAAAPLVVAAAFSEKLSDNDRVVATMVKIPRADMKGPLGDIDLLLSIAKGSASSLSPGLQAIEVKYESAAKNIFDRNLKALENATAQSLTSKIALTPHAASVRTAIALFDSTPQRRPIERVTRRSIGMDLYRVHPPQAPQRLTLSPRLLNLVFEPEVSLDKVLQSLKGAP